MVRRYGEAPYRAVLIHGGPGAAGSLGKCAEELSRLTGSGVLEPWQSKASIGELTQELYLQIRENCGEKVTLVGHSWGAWLAALFAGEHPELCSAAVLVGCPPLSDEYVEKISLRRLKNLPEQERMIFQRLVNGEASDADMEKIPGILEHTDNYCLTCKEEAKADVLDSRLYNSVWQEAVKMRTSGALLSAFHKITCRLVLIQGMSDPHPISGVTEPLERAGIDCEAYPLERCGHSPFAERYAKESFYKIVMGVTAASAVRPEKR